MKKTIVFLLILNIGLNAIFAQSYIETREIFKTSTNYKFSNEWQFISSDLYLFNANKFNFILNRISPVKKKKFRIFKKKNNEIIRNLLVTANLEGLGDLDKLTYPLFNFVVKKDEDGNYKVEVSDPEAIRIVDDVPMSAINGYIGVKVNVKIYSNKNKPEIYKFISKQLQVAASLSAANTTEAALKVVGEIGKMMENDAAGREYEFSSTIRIYEEENFDRQINSISIFVFVPVNEKTPHFTTKKLQNFMDTARVSTLSKNDIQKLIHITRYPYLVAVNYRTKYKPKISDDIDEQALESRSVKNETNYKNGMISREVYLQEKSLIDFLQQYIQLKKDINTYKLNYKSKITEDFTIQLFLALQDYWKLKNTYTIIDKANTDDSLYKNQFQPVYQRYLVNSSLLFEYNSDLRAVREHVETIYTLETEGSAKLDSASRESYLRKLKAITIPQREINSEEAVITNRWINNLKKEQYSKCFMPKINDYQNLPLDQESLEKIQNFKLSATKSYCDLCKINVNKFVESYLKRYDEYNYQKALNEQKKTVEKDKILVFKYNKQKNCLNTMIDSLYPDKNYPDNILLVKQTIQNIDKKIKNFNNLLNTSQNYVTTDEINAYISNLRDLRTSIETDFTAICQTEPQLCNCDEFKDNEKPAKNN